MQHGWALSAPGVVMPDPLFIVYCLIIETPQGLLSYHSLLLENTM